MILRPLAVWCFMVLTALWLPTTEAQTQSVRIGEYRFTIPADMQLERVTTEVQTTWPVVVDWDQRGRLLVVESGGVSKPIVQHNEQLLHRVVRLEDQNGDGVFDTRTVVAKDLPFMEGVLSIGDDLLVSAPPNIYRLIDGDGDGVCEDREVWFDGQTVTGCANDLHGPYLGRDGWVYWCKGAFAEQQHELLSGGELTTSAAHIFRRRLSGGPIEPVMSGGMDNPVEVAITPAGERFFTSTFLHRPAPGLRDGIAHAVYGGLYGKDNHVIDGHVRTGDLMPIMIELGAAAPSGLICLDSAGLMPAAQSAAQGAAERAAQSGERTLVAALFNLQKVTAHHLTAEGASFTSRNTDLVVADRVDFHPTDILEDADGSLLIVDTGGWYNLCCPSSRVDQKTAAGGIYRLSRRDSEPLAKHDAQLQSQSSFSQRLTDHRPWVARLAQLELLSLPTASTPPVVADLTEGMRDSKQNIDQRLKCLWGLCSLGTEPALLAITQQLSPSPKTDSTDSQLLQAACHALAVHRFQAAQQPLQQLLVHSDLHVRRTAAEALGRVGDNESARPLMDSLKLSSSPDRHWEHSVAYALIELKASETVLQWLVATDFRQELNAAQKMVAMTAIEQLGAAERLPAALLLDGLTSEKENYSRTASEILARHPQWADDYVSAMSDLFTQAGSASHSAAASALTTLVTGWRETAPVLELTTAWLSAPEQATPVQQQLLWRLMAGFANSPLPAAWDQPLAKWLREAPASPQRELVRVLAQLDLSKSPAVTQELLARAQEAAELEDSLRFLAALPAGAACDNRHLEAGLLQGLASRPSDEQLGESDTAVSLQALASQALQRVKLSSASGQELLSSLAEQSPRVLPIAVEALSRIGDDSLDIHMLTLLGQLPAARTLSQDQLLNLYRHRSKALQGAATEAVASLTRPSSDIEQQVDQMLARLTSGDPVRGLQLFRSNKTACSGCHRLGYVGGEIGPDLSRIGSSRSRRALLEAILFPSARLEQSYQPTKILTQDGQVYNGLITKHLSPTQFELQLTADKALVLSTEDVAEQQTSELSIMPSGLAELLTPEELSDLLSILESAK